MKEDKTLSELSQGVSKSAISKWKHQLEANGSGLFNAQHRFMDDKERIKRLTGFMPRSGSLTLECDFFKKSVGELSLNKGIALARQGTLGKGLSRAKPEIINSDHGSQFTKWIEMANNNNALISMDGKGRWMNNIQIERFWRSLKYEDVYIRHYDSMVEARRLIDASFIIASERIRR